MAKREEFTGCVTDFDREHGKARPCKHCGWAWSIHRASDNLCPVTREDGTPWVGAWEANGAPGTHYEPRELSDEVRAKLYGGQTE